MNSARPSRARCSAGKSTHFLERTGEYKKRYLLHPVTLTVSNKVNYPSLRHLWQQAPNAIFRALLSLPQPRAFHPGAN